MRAASDLKWQVGQVGAGGEVCTCVWGWGWGGWDQHLTARLICPPGTRIPGHQSTTVTRRCNKGRPVVLTPTRIPSHTLNPTLTSLFPESSDKRPPSNQFQGTCVSKYPGFLLLREGGGNPCSCVFLCVGLEHVTQQPNAPGAPYAIWGNPSPLPAQMPSLEQLPRTTPRLDSTHIYACRHIQSRRQTRGAAHPALPSSLAPHSEDPSEQE